VSSPSQSLPSRPHRSLAVPVAFLLAAGLLAASGCSSGSDGSDTAAPATTVVDGPCTPETDEKPAKALLRCAEGSVAFVENEDASGTGVAIADGDDIYVLTNAHVVDPFDTADVTIGGELIPYVPVVGIDAGADIALVGPLDTDGKLPEPITVATDVALERGDDVYLVGYPGEVSTDDPEDLEATIASGIISRTREVKRFEQTYYQTDASIAGGQSGGPLFDDAGDLVGISGLSFAEEFALALSGTDVAEAVERILAGSGDSEYPNVPREPNDGLATSGTIRIADAADSQQLFIPSDAADRVLKFTVDTAANPVVSIASNQAEEPLAISHNAVEVIGELQRQIAAANGGNPDEIPDPADYGVSEKTTAPETSPGVFAVDIEAYADTYITIEAPLTTVAVEVGFNSNFGVFTLTGPPSEEKLEVGDSVDRVIATYEGLATYLVTLEVGQQVEIVAESPQSDVAIAIIDPGVELNPVTLGSPDGVEGIELIDDSDEGLYGYDAHKTLTAKTAGVYRIRLYSNDSVTILGRLSVLDCDKTQCGAKSAGSSDPDKDDGSDDSDK